MLHFTSRIIGVQLSEHFRRSAHLQAEPIIPFKQIRLKSRTISQAYLRLYPDIVPRIWEFHKVYVFRKERSTRDPRRFSTCVRPESVEEQPSSSVGTLAFLLARDSVSSSAPEPLARAQRFGCSHHLPSSDTARARAFVWALGISEEFLWRCQKRRDSSDEGPKLIVFLFVCGEWRSTINFSVFVWRPSRHNKRLERFDESQDKWTNLLESMFFNVSINRDLSFFHYFTVCKGTRKFMQSRPALKALHFSLNPWIQFIFGTSRDIWKENAAVN